jgi:hypothetical protein
MKKDTNKIVKLYNNVIIDLSQMLYVRAYRPINCNDYIIELITLNGSKLSLPYNSDLRTIWLKDFETIQNKMGI